MSGRPKKEEEEAIDKEARRLFELYTFKRKTIGAIAEAEGMHKSAVLRRIERHKRNEADRRAKLDRRVEALEKTIDELRRIMQVIRFDSKQQQKELRGLRAELWTQQDEGREKHEAILRSGRDNDLQRRLPRDITDTPKGGVGSNGPTLWKSQRGVR